MIQNIPIRTVEGRAIRAALKEVAPDMLKLSAIDYARIEQRVMEAMRDPNATPRNVGIDTDVEET